MCCLFNAFFPTAASRRKPSHVLPKQNTLLIFPYGCFLNGPLQRRFPSSLFPYLSPFLRRSFPIDFIPQHPRPSAPTPVFEEQRAQNACLIFFSRILSTRVPIFRKLMSSLASFILCYFYMRVYIPVSQTAQTPIPILSHPCHAFVFARFPIFSHASRSISRISRTLSLPRVPFPKIPLFTPSGSKMEMGAARRHTPPTRGKRVSRGTRNTTKKQSKTKSPQHYKGNYRIRDGGRQEPIEISRDS